MLETPNDRKREDEIADLISKEWKCEWGSMGIYSPFDKYFMRNNKLVAIAEIKDRKNRSSTSFDTIFLNLDKYFSLLLAEITMKIPSFYIVGLSDGIFYIKVGTITVSDLNTFVKGRVDRPNVANDIRPAIQIPVSLFIKLGNNKK